MEMSMVLMMARGWGRVLRKGCLLTRAHLPDIELNQLLVDIREVRLEIPLVSLLIQIRQAL